MMDALCARFKICHQNSTLYRPIIIDSRNVEQKYQKDPTKNNRNISKLAWKVFVCVAYLSNFHIFLNWENTLSVTLRYGSCLTNDIEIPSLYILIETEFEEAEWARSHYNQLNFIEEKNSHSSVSWSLGSFKKAIWSLGRFFHSKRTPEENSHLIFICYSWSLARRGSISVRCGWRFAQWAC